MFEKVSLEPYKQIGDQYQPMRLEKSVSKMGLRSLRCWTNDHFIKNIEISTRFSMFEGADFSNFRKSRFLEVWPMYPIQFFALFFIVATRIFFDEANDGLWPNYIFYKIVDSFLDFFDVQRTWIF